MGGVVSGPGEGERFDRGNRVITIKADLPQLSAIEIEFDSSFEVPAHRHEDHVDSFYVLDGEVEFVVDGEVVRAGPGTFVAAPPGTLHGFRNASSGLARVLNLHAPETGFTEAVRKQ
jgi:quercetin dioxygenase-like cupin family protein